MIVTVVTLGVPRMAPPVGFESVTVSVSGPSLIVSLTTGTTMVRLATPAAKVSTPPVLTKSTPPPVAVRPASAYCTVFWMVVGPTRCTVSVTDPADSATVEDAVAN